MCSTFSECSPNPYVFHTCLSWSWFLLVCLRIKSISVHIIPNCLVLLPRYPGLFGDVVDMLRPLMDIFGLLFRALGPSECFGVTGFTSRWVLRTLGLPGLFALVILIILAVSSCFGDSTRARQSAKGQAFFAGRTSSLFSYPTAAPYCDTAAVLYEHDRPADSHARCWNMCVAQCFFAFRRFA
eukprot:COSAG02_NODE_26873_length_622_cov_0.755258_2_plen_183_part_00